MSEYPTSMRPPIDLVGQYAELKKLSKRLDSYLRGGELGNDEQVIGVDNLQRRESLRDLTQAIAFDVELGDGWNIAMAVVLEDSRIPRDPSANDKEIARIRAFRKT